MENCIFCKIAAGEIPAKVIYEDDKIISFYDLNPQASVHVLVIPKTHLENLNGINETNLPYIAHIMQCIPVIASKLNLNNGYRVVFNTGSDACQSVFHLHAHILGGNKLKDTMG